MAELTFKSAGVSITEIDLSQTSSVDSGGTPACVIGTSQRGPAFVPITVGSFNEFIEIFGNIDDKSYGAFAAKQWLKIDDSRLTFVRVLGAGDGSVLASNSGFVVGAKLPQEGSLGAAWIVDDNPYAKTAADAVDELSGNTYVLGAYMKDATDSTYLADAGMANVTGTVKAAGTITLTETPAAADTIKLVDTNGTSHEFAMSAVIPIFSEDDVYTDAASRIADHIAALNGGLSFTTSVLTVGVTEVITVTQVVAGASGNTTVTLDVNQTLGTSPVIMTDGTNATSATATVIFTSDPVDESTIIIDGSMTYEFNDGTAVDAPGTLKGVNSAASADFGASEFSAAVVADPGPGVWTSGGVVDPGDGTYSVTLTYGTSGVAGNVAIAYNDKDPTGSTFAGSSAEFSGGAAAIDATATLTLDNMVTKNVTQTLDIGGEIVTLDYSAASGGSTATAGFDGGTGSPLTWLTGKVAIVEELVRAINVLASVSADVGTPGSTILVTSLLVGVAGNTTIVLPSTPLIMETSNLLNGEDTGNAVPIMRAILMTPHSVIATLKSSTDDADALIDGGSIDGDGTEVDVGTAVTTLSLATKSMFGAVDATDDNSFVIQLNGFRPYASASPPNLKEITVSLDPQSTKYFLGGSLNTDPLLIEEKGHYVYMEKEVNETRAVVDGTGLVDDTKPVFLAPASNASVMNNFEGRYDHAITPWVKSQLFGSTDYNLFRLHALTDGAGESNTFKVEISSITPSSVGEYPTFDLKIYEFKEKADASVPLVDVGTVSYSSLSLDPTSANYIAKMIGDKNVFYNLDKSTPQLSDTGSYENTSKIIRVEVSGEVSSASIPKLTYPMGHRGYKKLKVGMLQSDNYDGDAYVATADTLAAAKEFPATYRKNITTGTTLVALETELRWGTQYSKIESLSEMNSVWELPSTFMNNLAKFLPADMLEENDDDFSLENIILTLDGDPTDNEFDWRYAVYDRQRSATLAVYDVPTATEEERYFNVDDLSNANSRLYARFTFFSQGGTNGTNIFREDKTNFTNNAVYWEIEDPVKQFGKNGPTVKAYKTALDVLSSKSDSEFNLLAIPGIRNTGVTNYAINMVENRFDALYIMDIERRDIDGLLVTSSDPDIQTVDANQTASSFAGLPYDSSFAAAYFPDVLINVSTVLGNILVPASVAVLGAFSQSDAMSYKWFAPAGEGRTAMDEIATTETSLSRENLDNLYEAKINPITTFPGTPYVIWGQKTLLKSASSLDRVNVRRLLIYIRRTVRAIALTFLFEPNRAETLEKFSALINPFLQSIMDNNGLDRFKVKIDTETTTQIDVENNTLRGKIYVQPAKTAEFISIDFVVSNTI